MILLVVLFVTSCKSTAKPAAVEPLAPVAEPAPPPPEPAPPAPAPEPAPPPEPAAAPTPQSDITGPELDVRFSSRYFSPDNDGTDDEYTIYLSATDPSGIGHWSFEIHESGESNRLFYKWEGDGTPPAELNWNGYNANGDELVQSAEEYPYIFTASDSLGNVSTGKGIIQIDVLVIKEGNRYRIQVPSIVFGSNEGDFQGLNEQTLRYNDWILRRIAVVLQKFDTYRVTVEGHANRTVAPSASAAVRQREDNELQALSEKRAKAVVEYLVGLRVDRSRMTALGIGGARPLVPYDDKNDWWKNRRVEFLLDR